MPNRRHRFRILPPCSEIDSPYGDFGRSVENVGARVVLFAAVGFLIVVMFGFGHAEPGAQEQLRVTVGELSPIFIKRDDNVPIGTLAPTTTTTTRGRWQ